MIKKIIKITLKSDLCAGSGYSYAGVIDSDTCYDELGLPFISGRRIKGCLREVGEMLGNKEVEKIFGKSGQSGLKEEETPIAIYDAKVAVYQEANRVADYQTISKAIRGAIDKKEITADDILTQFTNIKAQTRIDENGVAEDNSFRFTRVVNHYNPLDKNELVFEAPVEIYEDSLLNDLNCLVRGLRHIGMNRNRGLGNVSCLLVNDYSDTTRNVEVKDNAKEKKYVRLTYTIKSESPLMISKNSDDKSESYINGQTVLGFFASKYLYENEVGDTFDSLFLKNEVIFTPLYPSDREGNVFYPVPSYICKLKKSGYIVNTSAVAPREADDWKKNPGQGNQPKKLKGKYINQSNSDIVVKEVDTEIIFHNRHGENKQLYSGTAIKEGQFFSGSIAGSYEKISVIKNILEKYDISFGKSRKAQYGKCSLVSAEINDVEQRDELYKEGTRILVTLQSDALFLNSCGYTVKTDEVRESIKNTLGIEEIPGEDPYTEIEVKELTGYYGVWNLRRQSIPCVGAGSTFEYILAKDCTINTAGYVGEKNGEGFGAIGVTINDRKWVIGESSLMENDKVENYDTSIVKPILLTKKVEDIKLQIMQQTNNIKTTSLNPSLVGRVTLMLNESINENKNDLMKVATAFETRIKNIKDEEKRKKVKVFYKEYYNPEALKKYDLSDLDEGIIEQLRIFALKEALVMLKYKNKEKEIKKHE